MTDELTVETNSAGRDEAVQLAAKLVTTQIVTALTVRKFTNRVLPKLLARESLTFSDSRLLIGFISALAYSSTLSVQSAHADFAQFRTVADYLKSLQGS